MITNVHQRSFAADPGVVGELLDTLSSRGDRVWPVEGWPRMKFDGPLGVGVAGGHGLIRYTVARYEPGREVWFEFTGPKGFDGGHGLAVISDGDRTILRHTIEMTPHGVGRVSWPLVIRPLHDALLEDALYRVSVDLGEPDPEPPTWSLWVRVLRRVLARSGRR